MFVAVAMNAGHIRIPIIKITHENQPPLSSKNEKGMNINPHTKVITYRIFFNKFLFITIIRVVILPFVTL